MIYVIVAAGICFLIPAFQLYLVARYTKDMPTHTLPFSEPEPSRPMDNFPAIPGVSAVGIPPENQGLPRERSDDQLVQPRSLRRSYTWFNLLYLPVFFFFVPTLTVGWWFVLFWLYSQRMADVPLSVFLIGPGPLVYFVPAIFLGIFSAAIPLDLFARLVLGRHYQDYQEWDRGRLGLENRKAVRRVVIVLGIIIVIPLTLFVALSMDCYARFSEEEIGFNSFWGFGERTYSYSQITHIVRTTIPSDLAGESGPHEHFQIEFNDGRTWRNSEVFGPRSVIVEREIIRFVCRKSGKPLQGKPLTPDLDK